MPLIALGLNHRTAPVSLREQVALDADAAAVALAELGQQQGVEEALILSTCNRTEIYAGVAEGAENVPQSWLERHQHLTAGRLDEFLYRYQDQDAVRHVFRVATGLDSMVLGEPQILGQVKDAYRQAHAAQTLRAPLDRLLQHTFAVAKQVRTDTRIGANTVSVAFTAVRLAEQVFTDLKQACVLLIGAGDTIELVARHLVEQHVARLIVVNRTAETARELASQYGGYATTLADLPQHLAEADIVISSTASRQPLVSREMVEQALVARRRKPMFMVDLAMPRDIEPGVGGLSDVYLYDIDDLRQVIDDNRFSRVTAAREAEAIIDLQVQRYMSWRQALSIKNPALEMRHHAEVYRDEVLAKAQHMLAHGKPADEALQFLAHTLTNKLLHHPSARLREAALNGDTELLHAAERLYEADDRELH
ncbi:MAG TPA: glutamyl-tRNA reductase [Rhodanobacter sp.]|jgi:glutamyl-tRNA reductase|nr:glutamyl-tRNA reductase [Rhodanobacter sp.]